MGESIAIDGSDLPAYADGQRFVSKNGRERAMSEYSVPDASWGHRSAVSTRNGGGYHGYKVHAAVDTLTGLPMAWTVETAKDAETKFALGLLDAVRERGCAVANAIMDKGYDNGPYPRRLQCSRRLPRHPVAPDLGRSAWRSQAARL